MATGHTPNGADRPQRRPRLAPFPAGVLVGAACFLLAFSLLGLGLTLTLKDADHRAAQQILDSYLLRYRRGGPAALQADFPHLLGCRTGFLRLAGPHLRLVLLAGDTDTNGMPDFDSFAPTLTRTWTGLRGHNSVGPWTVVSGPAGDGNVLQIGIDCSATLDLLARLGKLLLLAALVLLPLSAVPALVMGRAGKKRTERLRKAVEAAAAGQRPRSLPARGADREEERFVAAVSRLLDRHDRLARELQESMDNMAHDLRTPMTRLRTTVEYGLQEYNSVEQLRETLADCLEESDRVLAILNTMLTVAEAQADTVRLDLRPVDLRDILAEVIEMYQVLAEEQHVSIQLQAPEPVMVLVDRTRISQVWANLLDNAIKYGADRVRISLAVRGQMAEGRIEDNGMGISEAEKERIWERLYRGDRSRNRPGLGLGLTLVRAIVEAHHGSITVESRMQQGTTFTVRLPRPGLPSSPAQQ